MKTKRSQKLLERLNDIYCEVDDLMYSDLTKNNHELFHELDEIKGMIANIASKRCLK